MKHFTIFLAGITLFFSLFIGNNPIKAEASEPHSQTILIANQFLTPVPPKVKNYLEDGSISQNSDGSPTYDLRGPGNIQLLNVGPKRAADLLFSFFSVITIIVALQAGINVLFSKGDAVKFKKGIMAIIYAAIGIVLIGSAWMIVRLVLSINLGT